MLPFYHGYEFKSFDGGIKSQGMLFTPNDKSLLLGDFLQQNARPQQFIPRGAGMSFAAASFGDGVTSIDLRELSRIDVLDNRSKTITVEAGISVGVLLEYLLSNGFFLPILPGYPTITIGGCIAADVHGKNQARDGSFINQVEAFTLHHVNRGLIEVSRDSDSELFDLTVGGFGLTGTIISVTLKVKTIADSNIDMFVQQVDDIFALPELLSEAAVLNDYVVSWHDFNQAGARFGTGFLETGVIVNGDSEGASSSAITFPIKYSKSASTPMTLTSKTRGLNIPLSYCRMTSGFMNAFYTHNQLLKAGSPNRISLHDCYFPNTTLRDLYFHGFGSKGLHEHQAIVPKNQFSTYIEKIRWWLQRNDLQITMASSKWFNGSKKFLRFNGAGICFALDFPRCPTASKFLTFLDDLIIETQSTPNIHKDSRLPQSIVESAYLAEYDDFKSRLLSFDPKRSYQSELSRRLAL